MGYLTGKYVELVFFFTYFLYEQCEKHVSFKFKSFRKAQMCIN